MAKPRLLDLFCGAGGAAMSAREPALRQFVDMVANLSTRDIHGHPDLIFDLRDRANVVLRLVDHLAAVAVPPSASAEADGSQEGDGSAAPASSRLLAKPTAGGGACTTCRHPYAEHTGRSLYEGRLRPEEAKMGTGCEHREDFHHTCACSRYAAPAASDGLPSKEALARALRKVGSIQGHFEKGPKDEYGIESLVPVTDWEQTAAAILAELREPSVADGQEGA